MTIAWALQPPEPFLADLPERLGPFDVVGSIAEGGMGIVLRGQDRLTGRLVALKTVRGPRRSDAASIRREIVALGQMSHPGVIRLVDHGTWNDKPWMALELLDGRTVCDEIDLLWRPEGAPPDDAVAHPHRAPRRPAHGANGGPPGGRGPPS